MPFDPLPTRFVQSRLAELMPNLSAEESAWYAHCSGGSPGRALVIAAEQWFERNLRVADGLVSLSGGDAADLAEQWADEAKALGGIYKKSDPDVTATEATRHGLKALIHLAAGSYADVLRTLGAGAQTMSNTANAKHVKLLAERYDSSGAADAINRITLAERQLDLNANVQLVVETLLSDLAGLSNIRRSNSSFDRARNVAAS